MVITDLLVLGKDDVKGICKIICAKPNPVLIPFMQQQMFEAMCYWVMTHLCLGLLTAAHIVLEQNGEPVPESKKVQDFLTGIQDPQLAPATGMVMATMQFRNSFY